jgi:hypothetical protein
MFNKYILFFIHTTLNLYNKLCLFLFKLYFSPYFYRTYKGDIIECKYINYDYYISNDISAMVIYEGTDQLVVTYECDKLYNCYNRLIVNPDKYVLRPSYTYTNYVFMNISLLIEDIQLTMYLRTPQYNFYICDNVINSDFIIFYLQHILRIVSQKQYLFDPFHVDNLTYKLTILDHCFKQHNLTQNDSVILHKNTFTITHKNNKQE